MNYRGDLERRNPSLRSLSTFPPHPIFPSLQTPLATKTRCPSKKRGRRVDLQTLQGSNDLVPPAFAQEGFLLLVTTRILQIQHINASQSGEGTGEAMQVAEQPSAHRVPMSRLGFVERARGHLMGGDSWPQNPLAKVFWSTVPPIPKRAEPLGCIQHPPEKQSPLSPGGLSTAGACWQISGFGR